MLPEIERLLVLQLRDKTLSELETDLKRIPSERELAKSRLSSSQAAVESAKSALQEGEVAIKAVELDIETRKTTIGRLKQQQFETRKNEEYRALGTEVERYQQEIDDLETRELELMEESDALKQKLTNARDHLGKEEAIVNEELALLDQREAEEKKRLTEVSEERAQAAAKIDDEYLLDLYERLKTSRGTNVVVSLSASGQCEGCHVKVTPSTKIKVQADKELVQCENCGRILYAGE